jgi:hypothetical protein
MTLPSIHWFLGYINVCICEKCEAVTAELNVDSVLNNHFPFFITNEWLWWPTGLVFGVMRVKITVSAIIGWLDTIHWSIWCIIV